MEKKTRGSSKKTKISGTLCMPRLKGNTRNKRLSPMTLLERFREAVLRLIMLSALSKAASPQHTSSSAAIPPKYYSPVDSHHSQAVADCIEFIKKKASREENQDSSASSSAMDATREVVTPVPVM